MVVVVGRLIKGKVEVIVDFIPVVAATDPGGRKGKEKEQWPVPPARSSSESCSKPPAALPSRRFTHFWVDFLEGRIILVHLEVDLGGGNGERPLGHYHWGYKLRRCAEDHGPCKTRAATSGCGTSEADCALLRFLCRK